MAGRERCLLTNSLPKGGPVQTTYEEKLWLYSLYKQCELLCCARILEAIS